MRLHAFKNNPEKLLQEGLELISSSSDYKFVHRVVMVNLMLSGKMSSLQLSKFSGIPQRTLNQWLCTVDEFGFERLKAVKQEGRPRRLSEQQMVEIKDAVSNDPEIEGFRVWDGPSLSEFIRKKFDLELGVRQCQRILRELGFSLIRPQTFPSMGERDEKAREDFKKK